MKFVFCYSIPYTAIRSAASHRRVFQLCYTNTNHEDENLEIKFDSSLAATAVYRALTEKHAFYSCETVRGAVTSQFIRDLKVRNYNDAVWVPLLKIRTLKLYLTIIECLKNIFT